MTDQAKPFKRPWRSFLRFSVRALIVLVLVIGAGLGWIVRQAHQQQNAVAAIIQAGGSVKYDWEWSKGKSIPAGEPWAPRWVVDLVGVDHFGHVTRVSHSRPWTDNDPLIIHAGRLTYLERLDLDGRALGDWGLVHSIPGRRRMGALARVSRASGAGLIYLKGLSKLSEFSVRCSEVNDAGLAHLNGLTGLTKLDLTNTAISDAGLVHLKRLSKLITLEIGFTSITDAGLLHLKGLTDLSKLDLTYTAISDEGLVHLHELKRLSTLGLFGTAVTESGLKELRRALPTLTIYR
jgi:internalin A